MGGALGFLGRDGGVGGSKDAEGDEVHVLAGGDVADVVDTAHTHDNALWTDGLACTRLDVGGRRGKAPREAVAVDHGAPGPACAHGLAKHVEELECRCRKVHDHV